MIVTFCIDTVLYYVFLPDPDPRRRDRKDSTMRYTAKRLLFIRVLTRPSQTTGEDTSSFNGRPAFLFPLYACSPHSVPQKLWNWLEGLMWRMLTHLWTMVQGELGELWGMGELDCDSK
jgi:hypothetical protein